MKNWAGNIEWNPTAMEYPASEEAIRQVVSKAINDRQKIRMIGTGHSFTPLCAINEVMVSLDQYQGLISVDREKYTARVKAGTKLNLLGDLLFKEGMAMENLGDVDVQSIAGTISTGTHGTGQDFGTISTQVIALRWINGKGEIVECSAEKNHSLFKAAQVSLGLLGIITEVTLQCVPAYKLLVQNRKESIEALLPEIKERHAGNRNFEFYWMPYTDLAWTKTSNVVELGEPDKDNFFNYWSEYVLENYGFKLLCEWANLFPSQNESISRISAAAITEVKKVHYSHKVYATQRLVRFKEMEYNIPVAAFEAVWKELVKMVNTRKFNIHFPIENRVVKGDDILLSPAYKRDSAYIACHVYHKKDHRAYFKALEDLFRAYGGRPHWGKMNNLTNADIADLYPAFSTFAKHRADQDPDGVFLSPYFQKILGLST